MNKDFAVLLLLALLPFACISILVEAWWRIRHNQPYIAPPVVISYDNIAPSASPQNTGNRLVPLIIGLCIGTKRELSRNPLTRLLEIDVLSLLPCSLFHAEEGRYAFR
jgi:hypothetical protein